MSELGHLVVPTEDLRLAGDAVDPASLVDRIRAAAALPEEDAVTLPPAAYHSNGLLAREIERIFRREWICAGRADEIPDAGDWFSFEVVGEPMIIARGDDRKIRALSNVCAHRSAHLKSGRGNASSIQCPYHAWTYDLRGCLRGAPLMARTRGFALDAVKLPEFRVETWLGFIYVNLDPDALPLGPRLERLAEILAPFDVETLETLVHVGETWYANWKAIAENAMESYHVFSVHSATIQPVLPTQSIQPVVGETGFNVHRMTHRDDTGATSGRPHWRATIYPCHIIDVNEHMCSWLTVLPAGVGQSQVFTAQGARGTPTSDTVEGQRIREALRQGNELINGEDRSVVTSLQRATASRHAPTGRLNYPLEAPLWEFSRYLARLLT